MKFEDGLKPTYKRSLFNNTLKIGRPPTHSCRSLRCANCCSPFQVQNVQIIFVLDRFDLFSKTATPRKWVDTLRGLRDSFQDTVSYIVGLRHDPIYHEEMAAFGEMSRTGGRAHICCVGLLSRGGCSCANCPPYEGRRSCTERKRRFHQMLALAGGYPTLLKAVCRWWVLADDCPSKEAWLTTLLADVGIRIRLHDIWLGPHPRRAEGTRRLDANTYDRPPRAINVA